MRALFLIVPLVVPVVAGAHDGTRRHPEGSAQAGLPLAGAVWAPYHADPEHALNRVFRAMFLVEVGPSVVGAALPSGAEEAPLIPGWMLAWRDGEAGDGGLFGGDGRQLPREGFAPGEAARLRADLAALTDADVAELKARPALAVLFQHDLLRMVQRLADAERNPDLVTPLLDAAARVALSDAERDAILVPPVTADAGNEETAAARAYRVRNDEYREVLRESTRLFDAGRTLLWSRVYLAHPDGHGALETLIDEARGGARVNVPVGMRGLMVRGIVALGTDGTPYCTPVVVDVRSQLLANRDPLGRDNPTTSFDGVDFSILQLEREGLRRGETRAAYRLIGNDDQDLFRDYGTLKHTTYRAQCALCHRTTRTPEAHLGGYPLLRPHAKPRLAVSGNERLQLAVEQVERWIDGIRNR